MSQSQRRDDDGLRETSKPLGTLERAYTRCLRARQDYVEARLADHPQLDVYHTRMHVRTMAWFEALHPYIAERKGEIREFWEDAPLWPKSYATVRYPTCPACDAVYPPEDDSEDEEQVHQVGDVCIECGEGFLEHESYLDTDEQGNRLLEWETGLVTLESWQNRTTTDVEEWGQTRTRKRVVERPQRLAPDILKRVARYLDRCAEELDLLAETSKEMPVGVVPEK